MQLPNWSRNLLLRRRRNRERSARRELFAPVRLSLRRLEQRRVLDVSAAFATGTGLLELNITDASDTATVQDSGGDVSIRDASNNHIDIAVDGGGPMPVALSEVKRIVVRGDNAAAADQEVVIGTPLSLEDGLQIEDSVEVTTLRDSISSGASIELGSDVVLDNDILLVGTDLTFGGTIDSRPDVTRSLTINVGAGSVVFNGDIGAVVPLRGLDIQRADGGITFGDSSPVRIVSSTEFVSIGSTDAIHGTGVVFNGGTDATLQIVTTNDNVKINGATKLQSNLSISTGSLAGDITFTEASPIDNQAAELKNLTLDAGSGSVFLHQNVGTDPINMPIGKLTVLRAAGGVTIGTDASPVTNVHAADGIDIGVDSNEIAGSGIVLNGGSAVLVLEVNDTDIRLNGPTTLASDVRFDTGSGAGDVTLTNDTPVDSSEGEFNNLVFDVGAGSVFINEDLGRTNRIGSLTVMTAAGGVEFGQTITEVPGAGGTGPVEIINTEGGIDIGVGANAIGGAGVVFRGGAIARSTITTTGDAVRINGPTRLGTDLTVKTGSGGGDLTFTENSTVDGVTGTTSSLTLVLGEGALSFNANVGGNTPVGRLTVVSAKAGVTFGETAIVNLVRASQSIDIGVETSVIEGTGITLNGGGDQLSIETLNADVRLNGKIRAQSDIAIDTGGGGGAITLTSSATVDSHDGPGGMTFAERNSVTLDAGTGTVSINANLGVQQRLGSLVIERSAGIRLDGSDSVLMIDTSAGDVAFNGPVQLRSNVSIDTGTGGGDLTLSATSTIDSQPGEANNLSMTLDTGDALFGASIGAIDPLGEIRVVSANDVTTRSEVNSARIVQQAGSGTTIFESDVTTLSDIDLTGNHFVFNGPVITTGDGSISITHSGVLDIGSSADIRLEGAFDENGTGSVELAGDIVTSGNEIHFGTAVTLTDGEAAAVLLDTTAGNTAGAAIVFDRAVNARNGGIETLSLMAGTSGDITFDAAVGATVRVGQVRIIEANDVTLAGSLTSTNFVQDDGLGTTTFNRTVDANSASEISIDINTVNVTFLGAVTTTGDGRVELTVGGILDVAAGADMNLSGAFLQDGGGEVRTSADITTSDDDITFTDQVILGGAVQFDTGSGAGNLRLLSTLDGTNDCQEDITLVLGTGNALFQDAAGSSVGIGDVLVKDARDVRFASGLRANSIVQAAGSGDTRFDDPVTIKSAAGVDLTTGSVTINDTFDTSAAAGTIRLAASDDIAVNSSVNAGTATVELSAGDDVLLSSNGRIKTTGADVTIRADADFSSNGVGGAVLMSDGAVIDATGGVIEIMADENIRLGRLVTTTLVRLTSTSGAVVDGGNSGGADIVAGRLALRSSTGVGTANPIDIAVNTIAAENKRAGGIRVASANGSTLTIGAVDGLSGIMNGPIGAPENLVGEVEVIHVGAINATAPISNHGGSHTIIRAESSGDLTIDAPIQNRGGNGWLFLFSGGDLTINNSLPEPQAEVSVENEGAVRGEAIGAVTIDNSDSEYVIIRTHAERFPLTGTIAQLPPEFVDPARFPPETDTAFYTRLEAKLREIRESISGQATNFAPIFDIEPVDQGGSDVDASGRGIVKITIGDAVHLETNWHFTINWGDGTIENYTISGNPQASLGFLTATKLNTNRLPDLTNTPRIDSGVDGEPGVYYVHHRYLSPPNPEDPAAPIPIFATLRYDGREEGERALDVGRPSDGSGIFNGIRFFRNGTEPVQSVDADALTNPGQGAFFFIKVVESKIIPVESRQVTTVYVVENSTASTVATGASFEFVAASYEAEAFEEYRLFMRVVDDVVARSQPASMPHAGEGDQAFPLDIELLDEPLRIFRMRKFPNGHYRIYLEEVRTGRERLILDVHIYQGRVVPENFRDGAAERQPGSDDSSQLQIRTDPLAVSTASDSGDATESDEVEMEIVRAAALEQGPEADANDTATPRRGSNSPLPAAAAALPWGDRVRQALRSEKRTISRTSLRLRRHR